MVFAAPRPTPSVNTQDLEIDGFRSATPHADAAVIDLTDARDVYLRSCWAPPGTDAFLSLKGSSSRDIFLQSNHLDRAKSPVVMSEGFPTLQCSPR